MKTQNDQILEIYLEKIRRDFPEDIQLAFIYGSTVSGETHAKSDVDLVFVPKPGKGGPMAMSFLVGDIGYDFFPMTWARLERIASFEEPLAPLIAQAKVVYSATREHEERFEQLRGWIIDTLDAPLGMHILEKAGESIRQAMVACARMQIGEGIGETRQQSGEAIYALMNAVCQMNNRIFTRSTKYWLDELLRMKQLPDDFRSLYYEAIRANGMAAIRKATWALLSATQALYARLHARIKELSPMREVLPGTYEESICNWRHKLSLACATGDESLALLAGTGYQQFLNEIAGECGIPRLDLMRQFRAEDLPAFEKAAESIYAQYRQEMEAQGIVITEYSDANAFHAALLG